MDNITLDAFMAQLGEANSKILPVAESVAKRLKADYNMSVDSSEYVLKDSVPDVRDIPANDFKNPDRERTVTSYINTITKDRDDEVVLPEGAMLNDYRTLPIVLFGHQYDQLGVAKNEWIVPTDRNNIDRNYGLIAHSRYASIKANPFADQVYNWRLEEMPMGESIGFVPVEFVTPDDKAWEKLYDSWVKRVTGFLRGKGLEIGEAALEGIKRIFTKWLLLEYSDVMVPSNAHAVTLAVQKGLLTSDDIERYTIKVPDDEPIKTPIYENGKKIGDFIIPPNIYSMAASRYDTVTQGYGAAAGVPPDDIPGISIGKDNLVTKPETTEEYHRIPVNDCTITATIDIDKEKGIKALYCGDDKKVATYLFDKEQWSMAEAKAWVAENKDALDNIELVIKEGRVISAKNRVILQNTYDATGNAREALGELLKATEPDQDEIDLETIDNKSINTTRWNKSLSKAFDVPEKDDTPTTYIYGIMKEFLGCDTKEIFINKYLIPCPLLPTYLSAFKNVLGGFTDIDTRNFGRDVEVPPIYEVVKLNSTETDDFLIEGMGFYKANDKPLIVEFCPTWYGINVSLITTTVNRDWNKELLVKVQQWVKDNNFLKGEKFALSGEFLDETSDEWSDIVLDNEIEDPIRKSISSLNTKGKSMGSRGLMFVGPPGTGKTKTGRIMMKAPNTTFIWVSSEDFGRMSSDRVISLAFSLARDLAPTILFIEDIDTWLRTYMVDLLKTTMDGLKQNKGIITVLTSNDPERLPDALLDRPGRFHHILEFSLPSSKLRSEMITKWVGEIEDSVLKDLLSKTEGFSGAHIEELVTWAKMLAEDDDIPLAAALMQSLDRLLSQRQLISRIREGKKGVEWIDLAAIEDKSIDDIDLDDIDVTPVGNIDWGTVPLVKNDDISLSDADIEELTGLIAENMDMDVITSMVVDKFVAAKADESEAVQTIPSPLDLLSKARGKVKSQD